MNINFQHDDEKLISTYMEHYSLEKEGLSTINTFWAHEKVDDITAHDPEEGLRITLELLRRSKDDATLAYIAAGPLENLLVYHGKKIINKIRNEADSDERIQFALSGVWLDREKDEIYSEWEELMKKYNFIGDKPKEPL